MNQSTSLSSVAEDTPIQPALSEEGLNQFTHGIGFALSIWGAAHLLMQHGLNGSASVGYWIYAATLTSLYAASTLSHSFDDGPLRARYRTIDQICIFLFMAGIFTPISLACCDGWWQLPLVSMWLLVAIGVYWKLNHCGDEMVPVWFYLLVGAVPMLTFTRILHHMGTDGMLWILAAAVCYLVGVVFLVNDHRHRLFHPAWHLLVMLGSLCHYVAICDFTVAVS